MSNSGKLPPTPPAEGDATAHPTRRRTRKHPRATREANAEHLLLQSLALRIGQEAARQNGIPVDKYLPLDGDPHGAALALLPGTGDEPIQVRATLTLTISPKTGAVLNINPPPRH